MAENIFLAIHGDVAESVATAVDGRGRVLAVCTGQQLNHPQTGQKFNQNIRQLLDNLARLLGMDLQSLVSSAKNICLGAAGIVFDSDKSEAIQAIGEFSFPKESCIVCENCDIALPAGVAKNYGIVVLSAIGAVIKGRDIEGKTLRIDGWGYLLGDHGSGYHLGRTALRRIMRLYDEGCDDSHVLTKLVLKHLSLDSVQSLLNWYDSINAADEACQAISEIVTPLKEVMEKYNDPMAREIFDYGIKKLFQSVRIAVLRIEKEHFNFAGERIPIVLQGGVFKNCKYYREEFCKRIETHFKNLDIHLAQYRPIVGAIYYALAGDLILPEASTMQVVHDSIEEADFLGYYDFKISW
jgi:N-acetylglucosamine kinase-like BadF-type ATPase